MQGRALVDGKMICEGLLSFSLAAKPTKPQIHPTASVHASAIIGKDVAIGPYTKIGQNVVIGSTGTVKGDIEFGNNLKTENGADIDGYIKKTNKSKSTLTGDFLFKKKDKKETLETEERPEVVNKEALV